MKNIISLLSILFIFTLSTQISAQKNCKVLDSNIDSIYTGKCKRGLAHGKGIAIGIDTYKGKFSKGLPNGRGSYFWANGDIYKGVWKNGMRNGEGTLSLSIYRNDSIVSDSIISGLWENNKYIGPKPIPPKVSIKTSVDRYSFKMIDASKTRVLIKFLQNGSRNDNLFNFMMSSTSGVETKLGTLIGYEFIEFPVKIKVNYETLNKFRSAIYQVIFEFEITEPGDWRVEIHN